MPESQSQTTPSFPSERKHRSRSGSKRKKNQKNVRDLRLIIVITALLCIIYFVTFFLMYAKGDAKNPNGFLNSDANTILSYILFIVYIVHVSSLIKSFFLAKEYAKSFLKYRAFGIILTVILLVFVLLSIVNHETTSVSEFMMPDVIE